LYSYISKSSLNREVKNIQEWGRENLGSFSVKFAYDLITCYHASRRYNELFTCLWKVKALPNMLTTTWRVLLDRIPTIMCLSRRGVLVDTILSGMCRVEDELSQHLFLECKHAQSVWSLCFRWICIL